MKKMFHPYKALLVVLLLAFTGIQINALCPQRYLDRVFTKTKPRPNILYGGNKQNIDGNRTWLAFDLYEPEGDTASKRPLIILMHGGGFTINIPITRKSPEIQELAKDLSKRGYVVISPSYRLFRGTANGEIMLKTAVAAIFDINNLLCFLKNTVENGNPYRIDTANVFMGGSSAGAALALNFPAFIKDTSDLSDDLLTIAKEVAAFDGVDLQEKFSGFSCGTSIKGIISISGAILDSNLIKPSNTEFLIIHGVKDLATPYNEGFLQNDSNLLKVLGPGIFLDIFKRNDIRYHADIYPDAYHVPVLQPFGDDLMGALTQTLETGSIFNQPIMDSTKKGIASFCHRIMNIPPTNCVVTGINNSVKQGTIRIYPNPSAGEFNLETPDELIGKEIRLSMFDMTGAKISEEIRWGNPLLDLRLDRPSGTYFILLGDNRDERSVKFLEKIVLH